MDKFLSIIILWLIITIIGTIGIALDHLFDGGEIYTLKYAYSRFVTFLIIMQTFYWNLPAGVLKNTPTNDEIIINKYKEICHIGPKGEELIIFSPVFGAPIGTTVNDALFIRKLIITYKKSVQECNKASIQKKIEEEFKAITELRKLK